VLQDWEKAARAVVFDGVHAGIKCIRFGYRDLYTVPVQHRYCRSTHQDVFCENIYKL
jgi:hypothetical protein